MEGHCRIMCHDQYGNALKGRGETYSANNIEWEFEELQDGWIAIYREVY